MNLATQTDISNPLDTIDPAMNIGTPNPLDTIDPAVNTAPNPNLTMDQALINMDSDLTSMGLEADTALNPAVYNAGEDTLTEEQIMRILEGCPNELEFEPGNCSSSSDSDEDETSSPNEAVTSDPSKKWSFTRKLPYVTQFTKTSGLNTGRLENLQQYFDLLFTSCLLVFLVNNINTYAKRLIEANNKVYARITKWKDITVSEFRVFLGLLFHMGTIKCNRYEDYWSTDEQFDLKYFSKHMSRNRFMLILRCVNFYDENTGDNRLNKISGLVNIFNKTMNEIYYPGKVLCIDESLVLWRGRLLFRQFMKGKAHKYGVKLYLLTDQFGCVLKIIVYGGKCDTVLGGKNHVTKVVKDLLQGKLGVGHSVYMDNFYNSVELAEYLVEFNTHVTGTLRANRKGNPIQILNKKLAKQEKISMYNDKGVCITKWNDRREVLMISSEHDGEFEDFLGHNNIIKTKPKVVLNYNKYMGGVDKHDQMMSYYDSEHKTLRWYLKLGVHIFSMMLCNAHSLYNRFGDKPMPLYDFRQIIIRALVSSQQRADSLPSTPNDYHASYKLPRDPKTKRLKRKRCVVCWQKYNKRVDTGDYCPKCPKQPGLCQGFCFVEFHKTQAIV